MNDTNSMLRKIWLFARNNKGPFTLLAILFVFVSVVTISIIRKSPEVETETPIVIPFTTSAPRRPDDLPYLINKTDSKAKIKSYGWANNRLLYSTEDGIFEMGGETPKVNKKINQVHFNFKGEAVYNSFSQWFIMRTDFQEESIPIDAEFANLNDKGDHVLYFKDQTFYIYNIANKTSAEQNMGENKVFEYGWTGSDNIFIYQSENGKKFLSVLNTDFNNLYTLPIENTEEFLSINYDSGIAILKRNNVLIVKRFTAPKKELNFEFDPESSLKCFFIDDYQFLAIETTKPDKIGRVVDSLWKLDMSGNKIFLSNSNPIPNKLDLDVRLKTNSYKNIVPLVENNGPFWLMSLIPNQLPYYVDGEIVFFKPETQKHHEDLSF